MCKTYRVKRTIIRLILAAYVLLIHKPNPPECVEAETEHGFLALRKDHRSDLELCIQDIVEKTDSQTASNPSNKTQSGQINRFNLHFQYLYILKQASVLPKDQNE